MHTQASDAANQWAERRREALERAKNLRAKRDDDVGARRKTSAEHAERDRLAAKVAHAAKEANERAAKREAEALAAKIRGEVERELLAERERAMEVEGEAPRAAPMYVAVKAEAMPVMDVAMVDVKAKVKKPVMATAAVVPRAEVCDEVDAMDVGGADIEADMDAEAAQEPAESLVVEWSPPTNAKTVVKSEGKRQRSPLSVNGDIVRARARSNVTGTKPPPTTSSSVPKRPLVSKPTSTKSTVAPSASRAAGRPAVAKKPVGDGEKVHRQMFDKRESRRMNRGPFSAAVRRWRNRQSNASEATNEDGNALPTTPTVAPGSIYVFARKRPMFDPEKKRGEYDVVSVKRGSVAVVHNCQMHADLKRMFVKHCSYDLSGGVFDDKSQEHDVYARAAAPLVVQSLQGGVAALFMYGQTGSGKTHTMENIEAHAFEALFAGDAVAGVAGATSIDVSYFEIAGKTCVDLLQRGRVELRLKELFEEDGENLTTQMEVELMGAKEPTVKTAAELKAVIDEGKSRRQTSSTQCNAASSRSHAVLRLTVMLPNGSKGRLTLVDCAGSERKEDNVKHNEQQRKETAEINASLYALKECVRFRRLKFAGGKGANAVHVPYRNSPLTRVLAECFVREDATMAVIGTMSPASVDTEHSLATLKTINAIGGNEDTEGYSEEKEDVSRELRVDPMTGEVTEKAAERLIAPVKWSHDDVRTWLNTAARGAFKTVKLPSTLAGSQFVRMTPLVLKNMCGGDEQLSIKLHKAIRAEIARCSAMPRT